MGKEDDAAGTGWFPAAVVDLDTPPERPTIDKHPSSAALVTDLCTSDERVDLLLDASPVDLKTGGAGQYREQAKGGKRGRGVVSWTR